MVRQAIRSHHKALCRALPEDVAWALAMSRAGDTAATEALEHYNRKGALPIAWRIGRIQHSKHQKQGEEE